MPRRKVPAPEAGPRVTCQFCGESFGLNRFNAFRLKGTPEVPMIPKCQKCRLVGNAGMSHGNRRKADNLALERAFGVQRATPKRRPPLRVDVSDLYAPAPVVQDEAAAREIREAFAASAVSGLGGFDEDAPIGGRP